MLAYRSAAVAYNDHMVILIDKPTHVWSIELPTPKVSRRNRLTNTAAETLPCRTRRLFSRTCLSALMISLALPASVTAQQPVEFKWLAFAQLSAERIDGVDNTLAFDAERIRARLQADAGRLSVVAQFDLGVNDPSGRRPGSIPNGILDLFASYRFANKHTVRFGEFKTPLGMDFNLPVHALDITQRAMELGLALNRDFGVMLSGQNVLQGISYDVGIFNPAGRSQATRFDNAQVGKDSTFVARVRYDHGDWHAELAYGLTENAGGPATADYSVTDLAVRYTPNSWSFKAEWIDGSDVLGLQNRSERVHYLHGSYRLSQSLELVARRYAGRSQIGAASTDLSNTYLGLTKHFSNERKLRTRLQVNYVLAGQDQTAYTGLRGFRDDALFIQLQVYAEK